MTVWQSVLIVVGVLALAYAGLVATLVVTGRRADARALARFVPDCSVLFGRLLSDPRVSRGHRVLLVGLVAYLSMPFDLVPDFIPVAGHLDDAIVALLVLRTVLRGARADLIREHWPGGETSLAVVLRLAGQPAH
jgi:uncharacterized membrane protein YkvA (DUF1232 family)